MIITAFERKDFQQWCSNETTDIKKILLDRAHFFLMSMTTLKKEINSYTKYKTLIEGHLNYLGIHTEDVMNTAKLYNTCLVNQYITIIYDDAFFEALCKEENISYTGLQEYLNAISKYITDAIVIEWKMSRGIKISLAKVVNSKTGVKAFFPISYNLNDMIGCIQKLSGKIVTFSPGENIGPYIQKETIECSFSQDRLLSEFAIQQQLIQVYMYLCDFDIVDNNFFIDQSNWLYDEEHLTIAFKIILQNRFSNKFASKLFPVYENPSIYDILNFRCNDSYLSATTEYVCAYCSKLEKCKGCTGIDNVFLEVTANCPMYNRNSILTKDFSIDELMGNEVQQEIVTKFVKDFLD